ncbi:MAG: hypothetical protein C0598_12985 [Marinilabiliales bacterium]|nr:MAG: hypothetical protein C0598_12985 [Marinilabiliales bacterium]
MNKFILSLALIIAISFSAISQNYYSKVKINLQKSSISDVAKQGIDITEGSFRKGVHFTTDLSDIEISKLDNAGIDYKILIPDVKSYYAERASEGNYEIKRNINDEWHVPQNWEYGSMGGYYTLDEVMNELDDMASLYPNLITTRQVVSADTLTHEGRLMYWVKISDNPNIDEDEPEILYTAAHHAREVITPQQLIYYMWHLLENYNSDTDIQSLVDNTEMYFVPIVNPDGYEYNYTTNPNGGGMWRKNRNDNDDGTYGVDLNRNYGYKWGNDNDGSSPYTYDETYRGTGAFSEPETKNMRDFCNEHEFQIALNYHSYSNLLLYSWGWTPDLPEDYDLFNSHATLMSLENNYTTGPANTTIYNVNGDSNDWMYGERTTKEKIYAYVPEIGGNSDGFWPSISRIIPLCQENMLQNITAAQLVGSYAEVDEISPSITSETDNYLTYSIKRLGLADTEQFSVSITSLDDNVVSVGEADTFENMSLLQMETDSIAYTLLPNIESGTEYRLLLTVDNGLYTISDTINKIYGNMVVIFADYGDDMENWSSSKWDVTDEDSYSPSYSITDSKDTDYQDNLNAYINLDTTIDLSDVNMAFLTFWAKWDIEPAFDYVQILIKPEGQNYYTALSGNYTKMGGNEYLENDEPYYDGTSDWIYEEINISEFTNSKVNIRFLLYTDSYVVADGFYFDDLSFSVLSTITDINENHKEIFVSNIYPNPVDNTLKFSYNLTNYQNAELSIYNTIGHIVYKTSISNKSTIKTIDTKGLPAGIYYLNIKSEGKLSETKKFIKL